MTVHSGEGGRTITLTISYDGTRYAGWQRQANGLTIQGVLEDCLARMTGGPVVLHGAGRTDAGVHALAMTAHFKTGAVIPCDGLVRGMNSMMPEDIRIIAARDAAVGFHARKSAVAKTYRYQACAGSVLPPCERLYWAHYPRPVDTDAMDAALAGLVGEHDFGSFESSGSRSPEMRELGAVRTIFAATLTQLEDGRRLIFRITGSGFLRHMVRNIVGTVMEIGRGRRPVSDIARLLAAGDRSLAGVTAPAKGLFLEEVHYCRPDKSQISLSFFRMQRETRTRIRL